ARDRHALDDQRMAEGIHHDQGLAQLADGPFEGDGGPARVVEPSAATPVASPRTLLNSRSRSNLRRVNPTAMYMIRMVTATANTITAPSLARIEVSRSSGRVAI